MLRIDRRISVILSYGFCILGLIGIIGIGIALALEWTVAITTADSAIFSNQSAYGLWTYLLEYAILTLVLFSDIVLILLLNNVRHGLVFTDSSVACLRMISWASILAGVLAIPLAFLLELFSLLFIAFVGFFLGTVLRVVKNVIEEGVAIKEENDSTI